MQYKEYGSRNREVILLLHGGGLSWWSLRAAAEQLARQYRVILPILDGHAGSDRDFTTIARNAAEILAWVDAHLGGHVLLLGGLSLGGQVALEMLCQQPEVCRFALVESVSVSPSRLTHALIGPAFGSCYGLVEQKWFARLQFRSLRLPPPLFEEYYRDTCRITKQNMIAFLRESTCYAPNPALAECAAAVYLYAGSRETGAIRRSAQTLHRLLPGSTLRLLPGLYHGEFSICFPGRYAQAVQEILGAEL